MASDGVTRTTVDLSAYPDLVVVYLGMHVRTWRGLFKLLAIGPQIRRSVAEKPDGLLRHEDLLYSLIPPHLGMRQYWRDFASLEAWTRSGLHRGWWKSFLHDSGGTGFWHETYFIRGGMEAIYDDMPAPLGLGAFAPARDAKGGMFSARQRAGFEGAPPPPVVEESGL